MRLSTLLAFVLGLLAVIFSSCLSCEAVAQTLHGAPPVPVPNGNGAPAWTIDGGNVPVLALLWWAWRSLLARLDGLQAGQVQITATVDALEKDVRKLEVDVSRLEHDVHRGRPPSAAPGPMEPA